MSNINPDHLSAALIIDDIIDTPEKYEKISRYMQEPLLKTHFLKRLEMLSTPDRWLQTIFDNNLINNADKPPRRYLNPEKSSWQYPYWPAAEYLLAVLKKNGISREHIEIVNNIVLGMISDRDKEAEDITNPYADWQVFKVIAALPEDILSISHINFIAIALKEEGDNSLIAGDIAGGFLKKICRSSIDDSNKKSFLTKIIAATLSYRRTEDKWRPIRSNVQEFWLHRIIEENTTELANCCPAELAETAFQIIEEIVNADRSRFSIFNVPSIEGEEKELGSRFDYHKTIARFLQDMVNATEGDQKRAWVTRLLSEELNPYPIFRRIGIYLVDKNYDTLRSLFWGLNGNPLKNSLLKKEIYDLVKHNAKNMTEEEVNQYIYWLDEEPSVRDDIDEAERPRYVAYYKLEWLSALSDIEEGPHRAIEANLKKTYNQEIKHPGRTIWVETSDTDPSPLFDPNMVQKLKEAIVRADLSAFKELLNGGQGERFDFSLGKAISEEIEAFTALLPNTLDANYHYLSQMVMVYQSRQQENKSIDIPKVLDWMTSILDRIIKENPTDNTFLLIHRVSDFLYAGVSPDEKPWPAEYSVKIHAAILSLLALPALTQEFPEGAFQIWNHAETKKWSAVMEYLRRMVTGDNKKEKGERWQGNEDIKEILSKCFTGEKEVSPYFHFSTAMYLPLFNYIDEEYFEFCRKHLFPLNTERAEFFKISFYGYLSARTLYINIEDALTEEYKHAAGVFGDMSKTDSYFISRLAHHLLNRHFFDTRDPDRKDKNDKRIFTFIERSDPQLIKEIAAEMWRSDIGKVRDFTIELWEKIDERMDADETSRSVILPQLISLLPYVYEDKKIQSLILKEMAYYPESELYTGRVFSDLAQESYEKHPQFFINLLNIIVDKIKGRAYLLKDCAPPILIATYEKGSSEDKETADEVVNKLLEIEFYEAVDIHRKYRGPQ